VKIGTPAAGEVSVGVSDAMRAGHASDQTTSAKCKLFLYKYQLSIIDPRDKVVL